VAIENKKTRISLDFPSPEHAVGFYEMLCEKIPMWSTHNLLVENDHNTWVAVNRPRTNKQMVGWEYYTEPTYDEDGKPSELGELNVWIYD